MNFRMIIMKIWRGRAVPSRYISLVMLSETVAGTICSHHHPAARSPAACHHAAARAGSPCRQTVFFRNRLDLRAKVADILSERRDAGRVGFRLAILGTEIQLLGYELFAQSERLLPEFLQGFR